jgi:hypothetical protein
MTLAELSVDSLGRDAADRADGRPTSIPDTAFSGRRWATSQEHPHGRRAGEAWGDMTAGWQPRRRPHHAVSCVALAH